MSSKTLIKIITVLIFATVIVVPLFYQRYGVYPYTWAKGLLAQALVELILALWLLLAISDRRYRPHWNLFTKLLTVFAAVLVLTALLGKDPWRSFWSTYDRAFGVFTILHLIGLALVLSSLWKELPWRKFFYASVATAVTVGVMAVLQLRIHNLLLEEPVGTRPGATFGNPAFLSGYLLFNIFIGFYLLVSLFKKQENGQSMKLFSFHALFLAGGTGFLVFVLFLAQTRGDILGLGAAIFTLLILFAIKPPEIGLGLSNRRLYAGAAIFVIFFGAVFWFTRGSAVWEGIPGLSRFKDVSLESDYLRPRLIAARAAWQGFLENPLSGVGWDNFNLVFNKHYDPRSLRSGYQETRFDKPHNFLLEDLVAGGLLLLFAHLALFAFLFSTAWKMRDKLLGQTLIVVTAGYFVRNLFFFDTLGPALIFFVLLGYAGGERENMEREEAAGRPPSGPVPISRLTLGIVVAVAGGTIFFTAFLPMLASYLHYSAFTYITKGNIEEAIESFRDALKVPNPYRWNLVRDYAAAMADSYFYNKDSTPKDAVLEAIQEMEEVAKEHPKDAYNHYALVDMYNQISDIDPGRFLAAAEREAAIALTLSPNRQQTLLSLAKTKTLQGENETAQQLARAALALDEEVADSHFYYGLLSFVQGDYETGYQEVKRAVSLGKKWKKFYEPLSVANFFADYGKIEEALEFYRQANELNPDDIEVQVKIGIVYFAIGDLSNAKLWLERAGKNFDFKQSPAFGQLQPILDELGIAY